MKQVFLSTTTEFKEIETLEPGSWINLVNPSQSESMEIATAFNIDIADLRARAEQSDLLCHYPFGNHPNRRGHYHHLFGRVASPRHLYQSSLAEFLYLHAVPLYLSDPLS